MKHIIAALFSAILFITGIYSLYKPIGRELIPRLAPFFVGDKGIWGTIKNVANPEANEIKIDGISDVVNIARDSYGIPHIYASNYEDALFGLGYISARDRIFQIEYFNRLVAGESAEWFGSNYIEIDKFMLSLGLDKAAWDLLPSGSNSEEYNLFKIYSSGVNTFLGNEFEKIPSFEYSLLGIPNRYHRPVDAARAIMFYHFLLNWNMDDFFVQQIVNTIGVNDFIELFYHQLSHLKTLDNAKKITSIAPSSLEKTDKSFSNTFDLILKQKEQFENITGLKSSSISSNSVAIKGKDNTTYLSTDIHSPLVQPGLFYEVYLHINNQEIHGFTIPGIPGLLFGSNGKVSWTLNPAPVDIIDYVIVSDTIQITKEINYSITVKEASNVNHSVKFTKNGVLMNAGNELIEMRWAALQTGNIATGLKNGLFAETVSDLYTAYTDLNSPIQVVIATDKTNIGNFLIGRIPKRKEYLGLIDSKKNSFKWDGYLVNQLSINPKTNRIVYANQYPWNDGSEFYPYFTREGFYRTVRLNELVDQLNGTLKISDIEKLFRDVRMHEAELKPLLSDLFKGRINSPVIAIGNQLRNWDFLANKDATYPKFFLNLEKLAENITFDELPFRFYPNKEFVFEKILNEPNYRFLDSKATSEKENGTQLFEKIFNDAYDLTVLESGSPENWTWAVSNKAIIKNISNNAVLNQLNDLTLTREGFTNTVLRSEDGVFPISSSLRFSSTFNKGKVETRSLHFSGNSANRYSKYFENQLALWAGNELKPHVPKVSFDSLKSNGYLMMKANQ